MDVSLNDSHKQEIFHRNHQKLHSITHQYIIHISPLQSTFDKNMGTDIYMYGTNDIGSCADMICNGHLITNKESRSSKTVTIVPFVSDHFNQVFDAPQTECAHVYIPQTDLTACNTTQNPSRILQPLDHTPPANPVSVYNYPSPTMRTDPSQRIDALPPSDFKDLIFAIQEYMFAYHTFLEPSSARSSAERDNELTFLLRQGQEIDASYGWVLASDVVFVARMMGGNHVAAKRWTKTLVRRVDEMREEVERLGREEA
jgi:hypothetical protein